MSRMNFEDIFGDDSHDYFDSIIDKFGLKASYVVYQNEDDDIIIDEQWISPKTKNVTANRIFKYDPNYIDLIRDECQVDVLNKVLELCVSVERYEEAATLSDILNGIVDIN